jgi:hypothetical protein
MKWICNGAQGGPEGRGLSEIFWSIEEVAQGIASSSRVTQRAKGTDLGKLWILEEVGSHLQEDELLCRSGLVEGKHQEKLHQVQCGTGSL